MGLVLRYYQGQFDIILLFILKIVYSGITVNCICLSLLTRHLHVSKTHGSEKSGRVIASVLEQWFNAVAV